MLSAASRAWAPSCRSRSIRRSSAAWVSTVSARDSASSRTRIASLALSVGPSSERAMYAFALSSRSPAAYQIMNAISATGIIRKLVQKFTVNSPPNGSVKTPSGVTPTSSG